MAKFNTIGAFIGAIVGMIGWIWFITIQRSNNIHSWGSDAYYFAPIFGGIGVAIGGFLVGAFQKENYENFHNETDEESKKRKKKLN